MREVGTGEKLEAWPCLRGWQPGELSEQAVRGSDARFSCSRPENPAASSVFVPSAASRLLRHYVEWRKVLWLSFAAAQAAATKGGFFNDFF